ncbi:MAG: VCBS domain-containing protein [Bilophila sp.]
MTTQYGTYTIDQDGKYTFTLDNDADAVRKLAAGTLTEQKVTVVVTDAQDNAVTQDVTVNITGKNTAPDFLGADGNRIMPDADGQVTVEANTENSPLKELEGSDDVTLTGEFGFADPDDGGSVVARFATDAKGNVIRLSDEEPTMIQGEYGKLTIYPDGSYTYTYTSDALGEGDFASENFTLKLTDNYGASSEAQLVINLAGTNDAPVITRADNLEITESDDATTVTHPGTLVFTDADINDEPDVTVTFNGVDYGKIATGNYGNLVIGDIKPNGEVSYYYELTSKELGKGQTAKETFTIKVDDMNGGFVEQEIAVEVIGTDDAPEIKLATAPVNDKAGSFSFSDVDVDDTHSLSVLIDGQEHDVDMGTGKCIVKDVGTFTFTSTGEKSWTYTFEPDKALTDTLRPGDSKEVNFKIQVSDNNNAKDVSGELFVSYKGTNAAPVLGTETNGAEGTLTVTDGDLQYLAVLGSDSKEIARLDPAKATQT